MDTESSDGIRTKPVMGPELLVPYTLDCTPPVVVESQLLLRVDDHEVFERMSVRVKRSSHGNALGNRLPQALIKTFIIDSQADTADTSACECAGST